MFDVASSRIRIRGSASSARAIEISWRSPAESPAPPSRTSVLQPSVKPRDHPVDPDRGVRSCSHLLGRSPPVGRSGCCRRSCPRTGTDPAAPRPAAGDSCVARRRAGSCRRSAPPRSADRRTGPPAWPAFTCRPPTGRPARSGRRRARGMSMPCSTSDSAVGEGHSRRCRCCPRSAAALFALRPVGDSGWLVEHRGDLDHRRSGAPCSCPVDVGQLLQRLEHQRKQVDGGDQRADGQRAVGQQAGSRSPARRRSRSRPSARSPGRTPRTASGRRRWPCGWRRSARRTAPGMCARG